MCFYSQGNALWTKPARGESRVHAIIFLALGSDSLYAIKLELVGCLLNILHLLLRSRNACRQTGVHHGAARFV